jgi:hypothetical protein
MRTGRISVTRLKIVIYPGKQNTHSKNSWTGQQNWCLMVMLDQWWPHYSVISGKFFLKNWPNFTLGDFNFALKVKWFNLVNDGFPWDFIAHKNNMTLHLEEGILFQWNSNCFNNLLSFVSQNCLQWQKEGIVVMFNFVGHRQSY